MKKLARLLTATSVSSLFLALASSASAQEATLSASKGGTGGTGSALLNAGGGGITYILFFAGLALFVFGSLKIVASFRD